MSLKKARLVKPEEIPFLKRIKVRILDVLGVYGVKAFEVDGPYGRLEFYFGFCKEHGYYVNYPQGHKKLLYCPKCQEKV